MRDLSLFPFLATRGRAGTGSVGASHPRDGGRHCLPAEEASGARGCDTPRSNSRREGESSNTNEMIDKKSYRRPIFPIEKCLSVENDNRKYSITAVAGSSLAQRDIRNCRQLMCGGEW